MEKTCSKCGDKKDINDFYKSKNKQDGHQPYCKKCLCKTSIRYYKEHYRNDPDRMAKISERTQARKEACFAITDFVKEQNGCCVCAEKSSVCLDFHHPNNDKEDEVSRWVVKKSKDKIIKEMKKCIVICANCHRKHHANLLIVPQNLCVVDLQKIEEVWSETLRKSGLIFKGL